MGGFQRILKLKDRSHYLEDFGIQGERVAVLATDWMATGPMVQEAFPTFIITGNPQKEVTRKESKKIILSRVFSEATGKKMLLPFSEKSIHETVANKGATSGDQKQGNNLVKQIGQELYEERIKGKLEKAAEEDLAYLFPYQAFRIDFNFFKDLGMKVLASNNFSTLSLLSNKVHFYKFLERKGFKKIRGDVVSSEDEALELFEDLGKDVYATKERGAGGEASYHLKSKKDVKKVFLNYEGKVLMQEWVDKVKASPNVLAVIPKGDISRREVAVIMASDQIIANTRYQGNVFPTSINGKAFRDLIGLVKKIGVELAKMGYVGIFGLDALVKEKEIGSEVYPVELNLRVNHSHGIAGLFYSRLKPEMPPLSVLHTAAVLEKGWLDNKELDKLPVKPEEQDSYYYIKNFRASGWRRTSDFSLNNNVIPVGFPRKGWLIPPIGSYSKISGEWAPNQPMFLGRLLASGDNLKEIEVKMMASKIKILKEFKTLRAWRW